MMGEARENRETDGQAWFQEDTRCQWRMGGEKAEGTEADSEAVTLS